MLQSTVNLWRYPYTRIKLVFVLQTERRTQTHTTHSTIASRSAMSPSTIRWMMLLCSSSDRFLWETRGVLYLVAGDGSTPCSQAWLSISSREARRLGSLWSMRSIRLKPGEGQRLEWIMGILWNDLTLAVSVMWVQPRDVVSQTTAGSGWCWLLWQLD